MPQVRAEFNYQPSADAERYEIYLGTQRLGFSDTLQFTADLELEYGVHRFSVRGINVDGNGPFIATQTELLEPYVPLPTPGPIGALEVSLTILGSGVGGGEPPLTSGDPWDLWGARTAPSEFSSLTWPTAPVASNSVSATSISQLNSLAVSGNIVTLAPGSYSGTVNLSNSDVHLILTGCTITGNLSYTGQRCRVDGGRFTMHSSNTWNNPTDILLVNTYFDRPTSDFNNSTFDIIGTNMRRVAFVSCTINAQDTGRGVYQNAVGGSTSSDLIFAGCLVDAVGGGQGWGIRVNGCDRTVVVDTRIAMTSPNQSGRYHADDNAAISGYYAARNDVIGGTWNNAPFSSTGYTGGSMTGTYFYDNDFYSNDSNGRLAFDPGNTGTMTTVRCEDNTHYWASGPGSMSIQQGSLSDAVFNNNVSASYVTPPAFAYGSDQ